MNVRALKRRLEVLNHQPPKVFNKQELDGGKRLLKAAEEHHAERKKDTNRNIYDCSYEAAGDLINMGRGRVMSLGGFGSGYRLGSGRWKYINKKWEKVGG